MAFESLDSEQEQKRPGHHELAHAFGTPRPILLLQGPVGSFFRRFAQALEHAGLPVYKIQFNLADIVFQRHKNSEIFRGDIEAWSKRLTELCQTLHPQAIIIFGDRRPVHNVACEIAAQHGIKLFSFEEGYLRPDFITFELGGNNARTLMPRDPSAFPKERAHRPFQPVGRSFERTAISATLYYILHRAGHWLYPHYQHHRERKLASEALFWNRNLLRKLISDRRDEKFCRKIVMDEQWRDFVVALQVHDDMQLVHHGRGWTQEEFIRATIRSMAQHAPQNTRLVFRYHPMDRGHSSYAELIRSYARENGVTERVLLLYGGHSPTLLDHSTGFITINSTMALSAMHHHCPVYAFGDTMYRIPGLTARSCDDDGLADFWVNPPPVDIELYRDFREMLMQTSQINGSFYVPKFYDRMIAAVLARLAQHGIGPHAAQD